MDKHERARRRAPSFEEYQESTAESYERYFVPAIGQRFAAMLVERAALRPGERVLDVACGTGIVARLAARQVGGAGAVHGLDVNAGMLAVARKAAPEHARLEWHEASADSMPLPDGSFDAVLCSLGLEFLPDKPAALREMRRVLARGGRAAVVVPGPTPPPLAAMADGLARHVAPELAGFVHAVFSLHDPDELRGLFASAGFDDVSVESTAELLRLPPPEEFLWQYVHSTPLAGPVASASPEQRLALQRDVTAAWEPFVRDGALVVEVGALLAAAC